MLRSLLLAVSAVMLMAANVQAYEIVLDDHLSSLVEFLEVTEDSRSRSYNELIIKIRLKKNISSGGLNTIDSIYYDKDGVEIETGMIPIQGKLTKGTVKKIEVLLIPKETVKIFFFTNMI